VYNLFLYVTRSAQTGIFRFSIMNNKCINLYRMSQDFTNNAGAYSMSGNKKKVLCEV